MQLRLSTDFKTSNVVRMHSSLPVVNCVCVISYRQFFHSFIRIRLIVKSCQNATLHENDREAIEYNYTFNIKFTSEAADKI